MFPDISQQAIKKMPKNLFPEEPAVQWCSMCSIPFLCRSAPLNAKRVTTIDIKGAKEGKMDAGFLLFVAAKYTRVITGDSEVPPCYNFFGV